MSNVTDLEKFMLKFLELKFFIFLGDNLQEMSEPIFWGKYEKYYQFFVCWTIHESDKD